MSSLLQVRTAAAGDIPAIIGLFGEIDDFHTAAVPWAFRGSSSNPRSPAQVAAMIDGQDTTILVAVARERVVGHVGIELVTTRDEMPLVVRTYGLVRDLVVASDARKRGVGSALMHAVEDWVAARGADAVELTVWSFNEDAQRLYEQLGYATQLKRMRRVIR